VIILNEEEFLELKHGDIIVGISLNSDSYVFGNGTMLYVDHIEKESDGSSRTCIVSRILKMTEKPGVLISDKFYFSSRFIVYYYQNFKLIKIDEKEREEYELKLFASKL
jgi:hypothetical protein